MCILSRYDRSCAHVDWGKPPHISILGVKNEICVDTVLFSNDISLTASEANVKVHVVGMSSDGQILAMPHIIIMLIGRL